MRERSNVIPWKKVLDPWGGGGRGEGGMETAGAGFCLHSH